MDTYTLFCLIITFIGGFDIFWLPVWNMVVTYKDGTYFSVSKINRHYFSIPRIFAEYISLLIIYRLIDSIHGIIVGAAGQVERLLTSIVAFVIWNLLMLFIQKKKQSALPLKRVLDVKEMTASIESEEFHKIGPAMWMSENWIRVCEQFYPKSMIMGVGRITTHGRHGLRYLLWIKTVDGKEYDNANIYCDQATKDAINTINESLAISKYKDLSQFNVHSLLFQYKGYAPFDTYMQSHTTTQLINDYSLIEGAVEEFQARNPYFNGK